MTLLSDEELTNIANNQFTLEFLRAKLVQQVAKDPKTYTGSGGVSQASDGTLELKMYCPIDSGSTLIEEFGVDGMVPGQLIGPEHYFAFEGMDFSGQFWTATNVWVGADVSFPASGCIIRSKLRSIENCRERPVVAGSSRKILVVPGIYKIPFVGAQPGTMEPGFSTCTIDLGAGRTCQIKTRAKALIIDIVLQGEDPEKYPKRVVEAIGIAVGAHLVPHAEITAAENKRVQTVHRLDEDASEYFRIMPPIPGGTPEDFPDFQTFVCAYVEHFHEPFSQLAGFWYRILVAFHSGLENQALVLSTAIEGILKASFPDEGKPDEEFLKQISQAVPKIKELTLGARARERILGALGNAKSSTPSNALYALAKAERIPQQLVSIWKGLRNKSAHADELKWSDAQTQPFIDDLYACLELFYRLIMIRIGYEGAFTQYSSHGWPKGKHFVFT
ncbi:hypothetical protein [Cupriavidus necator]|uniref:hypothetical protein n=1 Tax=Cupriavidus necator TaxID=106590 RepID=UPI00339DA612